MHAAAITRLLPEVVRRTYTSGSITETTVGVMEVLHAPVEDVLVNFDRYVDPYRCPARFVPFLAEWVGLGWLCQHAGEVVLGHDGTPSGDGPLRRLIGEAAHLAQHRGTVHGLTRTLELALDCSGVSVVNSPDRPFHITVVLPMTAHPFQSLAERIVRHDKPAFVTADVQFAATGGSAHA